MSVIGRACLKGAIAAAALLIWFYLYTGAFPATAGAIFWAGVLFISALCLELAG